MFVADQRHLADHEGVLELVLDGLGGDHFAAGGLEQLFFAIGNVEKAVVVKSRDVSGEEPAIAVEGAVVFSGLLPVTDENGGTADQEFSVAGQLELDIGHRLAHSAHAMQKRVIERDDGRSLGETVAFPDSYADRSKPLCGVDAERGSA